MKYAQKSIRRFQQLTDFKVRPYCITDRPDEIKEFAKPIVRNQGIKGWWNKVLTYSKDMPAGWNVYLDIDIVMLKNFDEEIQYAIDQNKKIACCSDAIMWHGNKFSSSMMVFKTGSMDDIYEKFKKSYKMLHNFEGGDQVWTGKYLNQEDVLYLDEKFPNLKKNLKFHLGEKVLGQWKFPSFVSSKVKMVDCGGQPKPHQLSHLKYIKENWTDI